MKINKNGTLKIGNYFVVTSGYCETSGLVSKSREGKLFLTEDGELFRLASLDEVKEYQEHHPILKQSVY